MDYVIINGKKSTLVKGLLIQSLPNIVKPLMRTKSEEIDGRDGDIITKLGYAAYDRTMKIGLFGDFDVYEVMAFFNTEGTVIFSNEPDMIYDFQITKEIEFEKLLRLRQANVVFHVQPFKHRAYTEAVQSTIWGNASNPATVCNYGNVYSRPNIQIDDSSGFATALSIYIDGVEKIKCLKPSGASSNERLYVRGEEMRTTYNQFSNSSLDRWVLCDYSKLIIPIGVHEISCSRGSFYVSNISRWV
jgi:phage-related protein